MGNKASLVLMELLVMVLVFALGAGCCLGCFLWAAETCRETALRDQALILAQNTAEALLATGSIPRALALQPETPGLFLRITPLPTALPALEEAEIIIAGTGGEEILSLTVAWQEVPHE